MSKVEQLANAVAKFREVTGSVPNPGGQSIGWINFSRVVTKVLRSGFRHE